MNPISDNELVLHYYRDGLDAERLAEIDRELTASASLRERHLQLQQRLAGVDALPSPEPHADFEQRLWQRLAPQLVASPQTRVEPHWLARLHGQWQSLFAPRLAWTAAFGLLVAVGVGFFVGRQTVPAPATDIVVAETGMASRVLDRYVADHLRATEGVLLTATNSDSAALLVGNRELAANLVESNRLYAAAAARQGNSRLSDFLLQLEPVLVTLANQPGSASIQSIQGLRDYLRETDLLFEVRATEARIDVADQRSL